MPARHSDRPRGTPQRQWEEEMLGEYLARFHPACRTLARVRLGPMVTATVDPTLSDEERRMLGNQSRRWADALCVERDKLNVIEAALVGDPRDISLLEHYMELVDVTPELEEVRGLPRHGLLVWAVGDAGLTSLAQRHGLEVVIFKPANFAEWLSVVRARERRPSKVHNVPDLLTGHV